MTGITDRTSKPLLSRISVGSLQDLGYKVNYAKADPFDRSDLGSTCTCRRNRISRRTLLDMRHGETLHLGLLRRGKMNKRRRRLRDDTRNAAIGHGRRILASREISSKDRTLLLNTNSGITYVGDMVVSVLVRQGNDIFGVAVRRDS